VEAGVIVAGIDRSQEKLDAPAEEPGLRPSAGDGRPVDLLDKGAALEWGAALVERFARLGCVHSGGSSSLN